MKRCMGRTASALGFTALALVLLGACAELQRLGITDPESGADHVSPHPPAPAPGSYYPSWPALDGGVAPAPEAKREKGGTRDPFLWETGSAFESSAPELTPKLDLNDGTITRRGAADMSAPAEPAPATP